MKILVTGAAGMLGKRLVETLSERHEIQAFSRRDLDVTSQAQVERAVSQARPDWVVHAAAFTRVDEAESNPEAFQVNALGSRNMAAAAFRHGSSILYFSTDYVFDGKSDVPLREWDPTGPINQYGKSKLAGEWFVRSLNPAHLIVRTSWLFGPDGSNFVDKILVRARAQPQLRVIDDQRGSPTFTRDLARASGDLIESGARGTYHVTNSGDCSWHEFAVALLEIAGLKASVRPIRTEDFQTPARRPAYSVLDNAMLKLEGTAPLRHWREAAADYLESGRG